MTSSSVAQRQKNRLGSIVWRQPTGDGDDESLEFAPVVTTTTPATTSSSKPKAGRRSSLCLYYHNPAERADFNNTFLTKSIKDVQVRHSQRLSAQQQNNDNNNAPTASTSNIMSPEQLAQLEQLHDAQDSKELDEYYDFDGTGQAQAEEFLANQMNIDLLQQDLNAAEALFFEQNPLDASAGSSTTNSTATVITTQFPIQLFHYLHYQNKEHAWHQKPFLIERLVVFFGNVPVDRLEQVCQRAQAAICQHAPQLWDPQGLTLCSVGRLFGAKLYMSISEDHDNQSDATDDAGQDKNKILEHQKVEYLTGTWLSKVYVGRAEEELDEWIDDAIGYVAEHYDNLQVHPHDGKSHWFVWYPNKLHADESTVQEGESVVVFFIQVSKAASA